MHSHIRAAPQHYSGLPPRVAKERRKKAGHVSIRKSMLIHEANVHSSLEEQLQTEIEAKAIVKKKRGRPPKNGL